MITTKKGKTGRPQISFSNQTTFSSPLKMPEFQTKYGNQPRTYSSWGYWRPLRPITRKISTRRPTRRPTPASPWVTRRIRPTLR
ncbi:MAG: hypothetical protein ACLRMJ_05730 [Alistipes finegoldii]